MFLKPRIIMTSTGEVVHVDLPHIKTRDSENETKNESRTATRVD
jgi:hypothetical protein